MCSHPHGVTRLLLYGPNLPYPTNNWAPQKQSSSNSAAGLLGPYLAQNFCTRSSSSPSYFPTDIDQAMHTLSLSSPDEQYYMDTGAISHMIWAQGTLINYFPLKHRLDNAIIVGNGQMIPVHGHGQISLPSSNESLTLTYVLHASKLIKNLISVRKFTRDNLVSVEFDPFGFSVKDLATKNVILRSNSTGDLYPFKSTHGSPPSSATPSAFFVLSLVFGNPI